MAIVYVNFCVLLLYNCLKISNDVLSQKDALESQNLVAVRFIDSAGQAPRALAHDVTGLCS